MPTFTYDLGTEIGKLRLRIGDHDLSETGEYVERGDWSCLFSDEELLSFIEDVGALNYTVVASALRAVANNRLLLAQYQRVIISDATVDLGALARDLMAQADKLDEKMSDIGGVAIVGRTTSTVWEPPYDLDTGLTYDQGY